MRNSRFTRSLLIGAALLALGGCDRAKKVFSLAPPSAEKAADSARAAADDMRVAREAMTIADVLAMLRANVPNDKIIADVKRRHLPQVLVDAGELELAANGADHRLLATLKDPANMLTEGQDKAYSQVLTERLQKTKPVAKAR